MTTQGDIMNLEPSMKKDCDQKYILQVLLWNLLDKEWVGVEHTYINIINYVTHKVEISKMTKELVIYILKYTMSERQMIDEQGQRIN